MSERVTEALKAIFDEIPTRLNINALVKDAYERLAAAAQADGTPLEHINDKLVEVLREIATHTVEQFTRRTGQPFWWTDEPEWEPNADGSNVTMHFSLDEKGNVVF